MRLRIVAAGISLVGALAWVSLAACELVLPTVANDGTSDAASNDASNDVANDASNVDTCAHVVPPPRPRVAQGSGSIDLLNAVQTFMFADAGQGPGYDLDGVCTCVSGPESCTSARGNAHCDSQGGRDIEGNTALGEVLERALVGTGFGNVDARIQAGRMTYLIETRHYNGGPDDDEVFVGFYDSSGLLDIDDAGTASRHPPSWDGKDAWSVDCNLSAAFCPAAQWLGDASISPGFYDPRAYVSGNVLVAHLSSIVLQLGLTTLRFSDVILTATIAAVDGGYRMDGQLAGRVSAHDIFVTSSSIHSGDTGNYLCGSDPTFQQFFRPRICDALDINSSPSKDRTGAPCDALSAAIPFTALPARVGYRFDSAPLVYGCDGSVDDCPAN